MKRIAIATFVRAYNYGAVLQAYALNRVLNSIGVDCETIDYNPEYFKNYYLRGQIGEIGFPKLKFAAIKNWLVKVYALLNIKKRWKHFTGFIKNNIRLSKVEFNNIEQIESELPNYDIFITGSDQVWSRIIKNDLFFLLGFSKAEKSIKASYAASFGKTNIDNDAIPFYRDCLSKMDHCSLREKGGADFFYQLTQKEAAVHCDPVFLLTQDEWRKITNRNKEKCPYILVYSVNKSDLIMGKAKELSEKTGYKVIYITCLLNSDTMSKVENKVNKYGFDYRVTCSPSEFVSLFLNAEYVLAASFHGTAFSLLFHKKFLSLMQENGIVNNRVEELLDSFELREQGSLDDLSAIENEIDWNRIDSVIDILRKNGIDYLKSIIQ